MKLFTACHRVAAPIRSSCWLLLISFLILAPVAFAQQATISGTVVDLSGASVARARIKLMFDGRSPDRETQSADSGDFSFPDVAPGPYRLSFNAKGFALKTIGGEVLAGQTLNLPPAALVIESITTEMNVTQTQAEIAQVQVKVQEQQRLLGLVPDYFTSYDREAVPLNSKQKLELTAKTWFDPSSFVIGGIIAGVWQAENTHKGFGQGAQGYAKRYGASFVDYGTRAISIKEPAQAVPAPCTPSAGRSSAAATTSRISSATPASSAVSQRASSPTTTTPQPTATKPA